MLKGIFAVDYNRLTDREIKQKVQEDGTNIVKVPENKRTKDLWLSAVNQNGMTLEFAPDNIKSDKEVVLRAVRNWPTAILYASEELKDDLDIGMSVAMRNKRRIKYLSERLQKLPEIMEIVELGG